MPESAKEMTMADVKETAPENVQEAKAPVEASPVEEKIDFAKELEAYKAKLERATTNTKFAREEARRLKKELEKAQQTPEPEEILPQEEISKVVERITEEKLDLWRKSHEAETIKQGLDALTDDPSEQELIRTVYENEIKPTGYDTSSVRQDLEKAFLLANRERLIKDSLTKIETRRMKADLELKAAVSASNAGLSQKSAPEAKPEYSGAELKWLERVGKLKIEGD